MNIKESKVLVVIVTFNASRWIEKCINSIQNQTVPCDIFVVDNKSSDNTLELLGKFDGLILNEESENLGFGKANNLGFAYALKEGYDFTYLLNQDAYMMPDCLEVALEAFTLESEAGIIASMQLNGIGSELDFRFQHYLSAKSCPGLLSDMYLNKLNDTYLCGFANAAAWLVPITTLEKVGFFDPIFFLYGEDSSYLDRMFYRGLELVLAPKSVVLHDREERKGGLNFARLRNQVKAEHLVTCLSMRLSFSKRLRQFTIYTLSLVKRKKPQLALYGVFFVLGNTFKLSRRRSLYKGGPKF